MLSWQQQDQMGRTTLLRSYTPGAGEWTLAAEISLNYDAADRLTQVYRRDGGERRWQRTSSVDYDRSLILQPRFRWTEEKEKKPGVEMA